MAVRTEERDGRLSIWYGDFLVVDSGDQVRVESKDGGSLLLPKQAWSELVGAWHQAQRKRARNGRGTAG
jgi:hypothetical protein